MNKQLKFESLIEAVLKEIAITISNDIPHNLQEVAATSFGLSTTGNQKIIDRITACRPFETLIFLCGLRIHTIEYEDYIPFAVAFEFLKASNNLRKIKPITQCGHLLESKIEKTYDEKKIVSLGSLLQAKASERVYKLLDLGHKPNEVIAISGSINSAILELARFRSKKTLDPIKDESKPLEEVYKEKIIPISTAFQTISLLTEDSWETTQISSHLGIVLGLIADCRLFSSLTKHHVRTRDDSVVHLLKTFPGQFMLRKMQNTNGNQNVHTSEEIQLSILKQIDSGAQIIQSALYHTKSLCSDMLEQTEASLDKLNTMNATEIRDSFRPLIMVLQDEIASLSLE